MAISKTQQMRPSLIDAVDTLNSVAPIVQETPAIDFGHSDELTIPAEGGTVYTQIEFATSKPETPVVICTPFCSEEPVFGQVLAADTKGAQIAVTGWSRDTEYKVSIDWVAISGR